MAKPFLQIKNIEITERNIRKTLITMKNILKLCAYMRKKKISYISFISVQITIRRKYNIEFIFIAKSLISLSLILPPFYCK